MTTYYLSFTDASGQTFSGDGNPLYEVTDFDLALLQTLTIGSQSSGAGKVTFEPFTFTLGSSQLTQQLDQWLASGTGLAEINLFGYDVGPDGKPVQVVHDVLKAVGVKSDSVDLGTGAHDFSVEFGGVVQSATPVSSAGVQGAPVVQGWNRVNNITDASLTSGIDGFPSVSLPTLNPSTAVPAPTDQAGSMYVRLITKTGTVVGGGWIEVANASVGLSDTLNIGSQSTGVGAGKVSFSPLSLDFAPGTIAPALLTDEAEGQLFSQIDVAVYAATGAGTGGAPLVEDYRFSTAAISSMTMSSSDPGVVTYDFDYGEEQIADYAGGASTPNVQGWDAITGAAATTLSTTYSAPPSTLTAAAQQAGDVSTAEGRSTTYYLAFVDNSGALVNQGGEFFAIDAYDASVLQTALLSTTTQSGKAAFQPLQFTLGSSALTKTLDQWLAAGTTLSQIELLGVNTTAAGQPVTVVQDAFKDVALNGDVIDAATGLHQFTASYGGLVEEATTTTVEGVQSDSTTSGWNIVSNTSDTSLTDSVGGGNDAPIIKYSSKLAVAASPDKAAEMYVRMVGSNGAVLGSGWIQLDAASLGLTSTTSVTSASGTTSGKVSFDPLSLTFAPGVLEPQLLNITASAVVISQLDVAVYGGGGADPALSQDFRFNTVAIASSVLSSDIQGDVTYTFDYAQEQIATYAPGALLPTVEGWDAKTNVADTNFSTTSPALPSTQSAIASQLADVATGEGASTQYYLSFTDSTGATFTIGGNPVFSVGVLDVSTSQTLNITGSSSAGAGKIAFGPVSFDLGSSSLTADLDQWLVSGVGLAQVNLYGFNSTTAGATPVVHDVLKAVGVKSDMIDASTGDHTLTLEYGGLVESDTSTTGAVTTLGWDETNNIQDDSLAAGVDGYPSVTPPSASPDKSNPGATDKAADMYVRLIDNVGAVLGSGWIQLDSASLGLEQTLNIGATGGSPGAGKVKFDPVSLTFSAGTLEPTLLTDLAAGLAFKQVDIAVYGGTGDALSADYRFELAALSTSDKTAAGEGAVTYTLEYGQAQIATYVSGVSTPYVEGWNEVQNISDTSFTGVAPTTEVAVKNQLAAISTGEGATSLACYAAGVRLTGESGAVAVEALKVGDRLMTLSGELRPIVWIGRRRYVCGGHPEPEKVWPVVVAAGAFGPGLPARDLVVSPGHAIYVEGRLVQAIRLVNGATIRQAPVAEVDYWHVELESHDVIFAEGLPAESYLDTGNRANFESAAEMAPHPDFSPKPWDATCYPYLADADLPALRASLLERVSAFGFAFDDDADLHALADGRRIEPMRLRPNRYAFVFPAGVSEALLVSRTWRPAEATADNSDPRTLGVCLSRLDIDGGTLDLSDERLTDGWSFNEPEYGQRWTTGRARLPAGLRVALLDVCGLGRYLRRARLVALEA